MTERTERVSFRSPGMAWDLAGILHLPADFDENGSYPAIVSVGRAASKDKRLLVVEDTSHYDLYDRPEPTRRAIEAATEFFGAHL
ncbi:MULTISPECIES: hypothetical protein [Streptomyces]|uniref:hypothetical protein n=1 Tax=Streptomyces TaxID=1883 RepID=UPI00211B1350|nr:hypothetical protein [Streptomyces sp. CS057]